jgi:short-subunit dehydrogenase
MDPMKVIIVGGTSGMGAAIATKYVQRGCWVGITGRRNELLLQMKEKFPDQVFISSFDVNDEEGQLKLSRLIEELGGLDLFIFNAGSGQVNESLDPVIEEQTTKTNVLGFVRLTSFIFNYFSRQGWGHIVVTSSVAGVRGLSKAPAYSASKSFISRYAESLYIKAKNQCGNIYVTDIRPGFVATKKIDGPPRFWEATVEKSAIQIVSAIDSKKRIAYITRRWGLVAWLMRTMPFRLYRKWT